MKKYRVKLSYPTIIQTQEQEYMLFPGQEIELPDDPVIETYKGLGYIAPIETQNKKTKEVNKDAG